LLHLFIATIGLHVAFAAQSDDIGLAIVRSVAVLVVAFRAWGAALYARPNIGEKAERPCPAATFRNLITKPRMMFAPEPFSLFNMLGTLGKS